MKLIGTVSCIQHSIRISGGGQNQGGASQNITLFRMEGHQCRFTTWEPVPISDGDWVSVSGRPSPSGVQIYAVRNFANGLTHNSGIVRPVMLGIFYSLFALIMGGIALSISSFLAGVVSIGFFAYSVHLFIAAHRAASALREVAE